MHLDFGVVLEFTGFLSVMITTIVLNLKNQITMKNAIIITSTMLGVAHLNEEPARSYLQIVRHIRGKRTI